MELNERFEGNLKLIQTVHWHVDQDGASAAMVGQQLLEIGEGRVLERVLVDSKVGTAGGGTGVSFNWDEARTLFTGAGDRLKLIVAGGLRPENVGEAIRQLNPWGVDVASGVEAQPGRKDPQRLAAFIRNARTSERS